MENNRILIHEDQKVFKEIIEDLRIFNPALNELKSAYLKLELGELTNDVYKDIINNGHASAKHKYFDALNKELDAAGLKKESFRKVHIDEANRIFEIFQVAIQKLKAVNPDPRGDKRSPSLSLKNISFIDGTFQVSAMDQEDILEKHCRIYLENKQEEQMYSKLKAVRDSLNDFYGCLEDVTVANGISDTSALNYMGFLNSITSLNQFIVDDDVKQINPESIKWVSEMIARAKSKK